MRRVPGYEDALQKDSKRQRLTRRLTPYRLAAAEGDATAQFILGKIYEEEQIDDDPAMKLRRAWIPRNQKEVVAGLSKPSMYLRRAAKVHAKNEKNGTLPSA